MSCRNLTLCAFLIPALLAPTEARAQMFGGIFGAWAQDSFDGTFGVGGEIGYDLPILPMDLFGSGTKFFPGCDDCDMHGWSVGANLRLPLPLVRPYLTGGWAWRDADQGPTVDPLSSGKDNGAFAGIGVDLAFSILRVFAEGRYELLDDPLEQFAVRAGVMIR